MASKNFSVIIPTYTGLSTIGACFESILKQNISEKNIDIIIVIDGPNKALLDICDSFHEKFIQKGYKLTVEQFLKNRGRFEARMKGAELSSADQLLFLDDRITFNNSYFQTIVNLNKNILIPNVSEVVAKNYISRCLFLLRRFVYGRNNFGTNFESYAITADNFETSPKGTTSLWVDKKTFLSACKKLKSQNNISKYTNEDTKLFKAFIDDGQDIYKSSETTIYYEPRAGAWEEIKHIYHRGPRFVDYYIKPGTRFFPLILVSVVISLCAASLGFINVELLLRSLLLIAFSFIAIGVLIQERISDVPKLALGLPIIATSFLLGLYKGLFIWLHNRAKHETQ